MKNHVLSRFLLAGIFLAAMVPFIHAQDRDHDRGRDRNWERARDVVSRTMEDLRHLERREAFAGDDRERYDHALRSLSEMDRAIAEGRLDRGRMDEAIEHVDHVSRSRVLDPRERDRVLDDLRDLRRLREDWR